MTRKELEVLKEHREEIAEAVREILWETEAESRNYCDTDIYLYVDEEGGVEVQPYYRTGNTWLLDEHHTIHTIKGYDIDTWQNYYDSISDISEALERPEKGLIDLAAEYCDTDPKRITLFDVVHMIDGCVYYHKEKQTLIDIRAEALKENYWEDYTEAARRIVDDYIENEERFTEEA